MTRNRQSAHQQDGAAIAYRRLDAPALDRLRPMALSTWDALQKCYASGISRDELDHFFARYLLGLTEALYAHDAPAAHLTALRALLGSVLPAERANRALRKFPALSSPWVNAAFRSLEELGIRDGTELIAGDYEGRDPLAEIDGDETQCSNSP